MRSSSAKFLNDKNHTFVIAEAGSNWKTKDLKTSIIRAKKMILIAKSSGPVLMGLYLLNVINYVLKTAQTTFETFRLNVTNRKLSIT